MPTRYKVVMFTVGVSLAATLALAASGPGYQVKRTYKHGGDGG
jgi:hypothetical protein